MNRLIVLSPVYNDWESARILAHELGSALTGMPHQVTLVFVDDGSTSSCDWNRTTFRGIAGLRSVEVLRLTRNLGHQRAIAIGLGHVCAKLKPSSVVILDSDGEDQPADVRRLVEESERSPDQIIFARRARRSEDWRFRAFYLLYRMLFRVLTGAGIAFGNFSIVPAALLRHVVHLPEIWNHYAAGVLRANSPHREIATSRGRRYAGESRMSFVALLLHGLSAISVYIEVVTARLIVGVLGMILLIGVGFLVILYVRYFTSLAIPGWATYMVMALIVIGLQSILFAAMLAILVLHYRTNKLFVPATDYAAFVRDVDQWK